MSQYPPNFSYVEVDKCGSGPRIFRVRPHSMGQTGFFVYFEKPFKKTVWSRHLFCFILKGKNKIRKKNPKCDS